MHMQRIKRNNFPKAVLDRIYEVDSVNVTLRDFLNINFYKNKKEYKDVTKISSNEARSVVDLEPGEAIFINTIQVKRIS